MNQLNEMKLVQAGEPLEISGRRVLFHLFGPVGFSGWGTTTLRVEGAWLVEESTSLLGQKNGCCRLRVWRAFRW